MRNEAMRALRAAEVPVERIQSIADLMSHPQVQARGNFIDVANSESDVRDGAGRETTCVSAPAPKLARGAGSVRWLGQRVGQATREVLQGELGLSDDTLADLAQRRIVGGN